MSKGVNGFVSKPGTGTSQPQKYQSLSYTYLLTLSLLFSVYYFNINMDNGYTLVKSHQMAIQVLTLFDTLPGLPSVT